MMATKTSTALAGLECFKRMGQLDKELICKMEYCPYWSEDDDTGTSLCNVPQIVADAIEALEAKEAEQKPRLLTMEEVLAEEAGAVLWVEEAQGVVWNLFPLEIYVTSKHPDTGTHYIFFITYHDIKQFECDEYNRTWRCWNTRPTEAQTKAAPWDKSGPAHGHTCGPDYCEL